MDVNVSCFSIFMSWGVGFGFVGEDAPRSLLRTGGF